MKTGRYHVLGDDLSRAPHIMNEKLLELSKTGSFFASVTIAFYNKLRNHFI